MALIAIAATALAVSIGTGVLSATRAKKAQKLDNQIRLSQLRRQRVRAIRQARIKRGQIANAAALTGTGGSSGFRGAVSGIQSQVAGTISFLDTIASLSSARSRAQQGASFFSSISGLAKQAGSFATTNAATLGLT